MTFDPYSYLKFIDFPLGLLYLTLIIYYLYYRRSVTYQAEPWSKFFIPGYIAKTFGGIAIILVYGFYYPGGDTYEYYNTSSMLYKLTFINFNHTLKLIFEPISIQNYLLFNDLTGYPSYEYYFDRQTWSVSRLSYVFVLLSFGRLIPSLILLNAFLYIGPWKLYRTLSQIYPHAYKVLAFSILFLPSILFWGSGMMKDAYTLCASTYIVATLVQWFVLRKFSPWSIFAVLFFSYVVISIKPYIFLSLLVFALVFIGYSQIKFIQNRILKYIIAPFFLFFIMIFLIFLYMSISPYLGVYGSIESLLQKASITQKDFVTNPYYSKNYFNIGYFEPTFSGVISKAHLALLYGLYGPFLWVARNPVMLISAIEASFFLIISLWFLFKILTNRKLFYLFINDPILISFFAFTIVFTIFVGISTANYGSLVRYRIPMLPYFMSFIFIVLYSSKNLSEYQQKLLS
ncbi:MAG: hypothetical protein N2Z72_00195 [Bacteroidales bacterium]|nr:hypothetical protein [Bacteroidales bacterium]